MKDSTTTVVGRDRAREKQTPKTATRTRRVPAEAAKLPAEVIESLWLDEVREGTHDKAIALREGVTLRWVQLGLTRARLRELAKARARDANPDDGAGRSAEGAGTPRRHHLGSRAGTRTMPRLIPLFPIGSFTPTSGCGHIGPLRAGSIFCCMVCHASGIEDHPDLKRDPLTEPDPEPAEQPAAPPDGRPSGGSRKAGRGPSAETRAERRRRQYAAPAMAC